MSTDRRQELLLGAEVTQVAVLSSGPATTLSALRALLGPSLFKSPRWRDALRDTAQARGLNPLRIARESDASDLMEGLYIKVEEDGEVKARYKFVRADFLTSTLDSGTHWLDRPIIPNGLRPPDARISMRGRFLAGRCTQ